MYEALIKTMLNHRLITSYTTPKQFIQEAIQFLLKHAKNKKVFCALSGGIDSSATYLLLERAKIDAIPVFIDHGFMRIIRGVEEREYIKKLFPHVIIIDIREEFLQKIYGEEDAEKKRMLFKDAYSQVISRVIKEEKCDLLADGTILPDIEESFGVEIQDLKETMSLREEKELMDAHKDGFVKSQHNLAIEYDVEATIQPVASLTKDQIRELLEYLEMPPELVYRKAFPGPALAARIIGSISKKNLSIEKKVHDIVESSIEDFYKEKYEKPMIINENGEQEPFQVFAAISENIMGMKVTGIIDGKRAYEYPLVIKGRWDYESLTNLASTIKGYARLLYELHFEPNGTYDIVIRSINSIDARSATVTNLPLKMLEKIQLKIREIAKIRSIYYDITPKPPATIEYV